MRKRTWAINTTAKTNRSNRRHSNIAVSGHQATRAPSYQNQILSFLAYWCLVPGAWCSFHNGPEVRDRLAQALFESALGFPFEMFPGQRDVRAAPLGVVQRELFV